jgi:hypothetical protein
MNPVSESDGGTGRNGDRKNQMGRWGETEIGRHGDGETGENRRQKAESSKQKVISDQ